MKEVKFENRLVEIFSTFEETMILHSKRMRESDTFILKNGYIDLKYDVVNLFMQAVNQHQFLGSLEFDFEVFKDKQRAESPLLKNEQ